YDDTGRELYVAERRFAGKGEFPLASALLFETDALSLSRNLKEAGLPIKIEEELQTLTTEQDRRASEQVALGRMKKSPVWIFAPGSAPRTQLIMEKDTFLPLQFVSESMGAPSDVRFENYR